MKKILLISAVMLTALTANAQVRAVGIGLGASETVSLQHCIYGQDNSFFQLDLGYHVGVPSSGMLCLTGTYNILFWSPEWTSVGKWNMYAGPGIRIGSDFSPLKSFSVGLAGQVGIEYLFDFPLQLSVDLRPSFGIRISESNFKYDIDGLMGFIPAVTARYRF